MDLIKTIEHKSFVSSVKFSPDNHYLAIGCKHTAEIFELSTGRLVSTLVDPEFTIQGRHYHVQELQFSPDSRALAIVHGDTIIRVSAKCLVRT